MTVLLKTTELIELKDKIRDEVMVPWRSKDIADDETLAAMASKVAVDYIESRPGVRRASIVTEGLKG